MSLLLQLALDAMTDRDALEVFADAVLEARWFDQRATRLITPRELPLLIEGGWMRAYAENARSDRNSPDWADWPRACAAVLLFGNWSTTPWPISDRLAFTGLVLQGRHGPVRVYSHGQMKGPITEIRFAETMAVASSKQSNG